MLGEYLEDPHSKEGLNDSKKNSFKGIGLLPLKTIFSRDKITKRITCYSNWPCIGKIDGFEIHNGITKVIKNDNRNKVSNIFKDNSLGWYKNCNKRGIIAGTYIHGIFENDKWTINLFNLIKEKKGIPILDKKNKSYKIKKEAIIDNLAEQFTKHINISTLLN